MSKLVCIVGITYGIICIVGGLKKNRKSYSWLEGFGGFIKDPVFSIVYGAFLVLVFALAFFLVTNFNTLIR